MSEEEDRKNVNVITSAGVQNMLDLFVDAGDEQVGDKSNLKGKDAAAARRAAKRGKEKAKGGKKKQIKETESPNEDKVLEDGNVETPEIEVDEHRFIPHTEMPIVTTPSTYTVCGVCNGPPEFCSYMARWEECRVWVEENCAQYLPDLVDSKKLIKKKVASTVPSGPKTIVIQKMKKGPKTITKVEGLHRYGISLTSAAKSFRKKFAAASTIQKDAAGVSYVEIQGDVTQQFMNDAVIQKTFPDVDIDMDTVTFVSAGKIRIKK